MKLRPVLFLLMIGLAMSGCIDPLPPPVETLAVTLLSERGAICRPLISHGDDWYVEPYDRRDLLFGTGRDQYGNPTGLSDDEQWEMKSVTIRCSEKAINDTIYNPGDPFRRNGFSANAIQNACTWFPLYTSGPETYSGLPFAPVPLVGYPFDPCRPIGSENMPSQTATITAKASRDRLLVRLTAPAFDGATYTLDAPGATPQTSNTLEVWVGKHGMVRVFVEVGGKVTPYEETIPVDWFWVSGEWTITVGATGTCR